MPSIITSYLFMLSKTVLQSKEGTSHNHFDSKNLYVQRDTKNFFSSIYRKSPCGRWFQSETYHSFLDGGNFFCIRRMKNQHDTKIGENCINLSSSMMLNT